MVDLTAQWRFRYNSNSNVGEGAGAWTDREAKNIVARYDGNELPMKGIGCLLPNARVDNAENEIGVETDEEYTFDK
jgi:hypothetical protein